jgi:hypothetical protein
LKPITASWKNNFCKPSSLQILKKPSRCLPDGEIFYNKRRRHGSLGQQPPKQVWDAYEKTNFALSGEADAGFGRGQPTRNSLMNGEEKGKQQLTLLLPLPNASLFPCLQKSIENSLTVFEKLSRK